MTKPVKFLEGVPMMKVGEYNDRVPIEGVTQTSNGAVTFGDPSESTSWCERGPGKLKHPGRDAVQHG